MPAPNPAKFLTNPKKSMKHYVRKFMIALQDYPDYLKYINFVYFHMLYMFRFENGPFVRQSNFYEVVDAFCDLPEMTIDIICFEKYVEAMLEMEVPGAKEFEAAIRAVYNPCVFCGEHVDEYDLSHRIGIYRGRNKWMEHHYECFFSEEGDRIRDRIFELKNYGTGGLKEGHNIFLSEDWDEFGLIKDLNDLILDLIMTRFSLNLDKMDELAIAKYQILFAKNLNILEQLPEDREDILKTARKIENAISDRFIYLHFGQPKKYIFANRDFEPTYKTICDVGMKCRADDPTLPIIEDYNEEHVRNLINEIEELTMKHREYMIKNYPSKYTPENHVYIENHDMEMENDDMEIEK